MQLIQVFFRKFMFMFFACSGVIVVGYASDAWRPLVCRYEYEHLPTQASIWAVNKISGEDEWCEYYDLASGYKTIYDDFTNGRSTYWNTRGEITHQETHGEDGEEFFSPPWRWGMKDQIVASPPPWVTSNEQLQELIKLTPRMP